MRYVLGLFIITLEMGSIIPVLVIIIGIVVIIIHGVGIIKYVVVYHDRYNGLSNDLKWSFITIDMGRIILVKYSHTMWSYLTTIATVIITLVTIYSDISRPIIM